MPSTSPVAVVTGAAGHIGRALLTRLTEAGHTVVGLDVSPPPPDSSSGVAAEWVVCDITDDTAVRAAFAQVEKRHGRLDLLVNNAGISAVGRFIDHDVATHARVMAVNYFGAVSCTQAALPALVRSGGRIVVTSSVTGFAPVVGRPAYVGAKHAVTGLFTSLRPELAADGVGVTVVHPTFVSEAMSDDGTHAGGPARSTTGPEVTADDVARAVVDGVRRGRDRVFVGRVARQSWHLWRLAPRTYVKVMTRRLQQ